MSREVILECLRAAMLANDRQEFESAVWWSRRALQIASDLPEAWYHLAVASAGLGRRREAVAAFQRASALTPSNAEAQNGIGLHLIEIGETELAEQCLLRAIHLAPEDAFPLVNLGRLRQQQHLLTEALDLLSRAAELKPDLAPVYVNLGAVKCELGRYQDAEHDCLKAVQLSPNFGEAWSNLGLVYLSQNRRLEAERAFRKAIELAPRNPDAYNNLGKTLHQLMRYEEAERVCRYATELAPDLFEAWSNLALALWGMKRYLEAADAFQKSLAKNPKAPYLRGYALYMRMMACDWRDFARERQHVLDGILGGERSIITFPLLALTDDLSLQRKAAEIYLANEYASAKPLLGCDSSGAPKQKIRLAYFSADFWDHPVSNLLVEILELHDRSKFEVIGISFGPDTGDAVSKRIREAFDQFIDVAAMSDAEVALLSRSMDIDIAVDLGGYTEGARPGVFALRAAPVQVSYLGYLATTGAPYIDYIIADPVLVPREKWGCYSEKIAWIPSYQANDSKRTVASKEYTRSELGLPEDGFVFACFNSTYKINPCMFGVWMRILQRVPDSVLFLYADNLEAKQNLCREAALCGVACERLIFGARIERSLYLARYRVADLFLDTFPYNAGTTASDALWAGLPVLTLQGESMASRMAASLLFSLDLSELVTTTPEEYEEVAVALAMQTHRLSEVRRRLQLNRATQILFDSHSFALEIEAVYIEMHERRLQGLPADHIALGARIGVMR